MKSRKVPYQGYRDVVELPDGLDGRRDIKSQKTTDDDQFRPISKGHCEESSSLSTSTVSYLRDSHQAYLKNKIRGPKGKPQQDIEPISCHKNLIWVISVLPLGDLVFRQTSVDICLEKSFWCSVCRIV